MADVLSDSFEQPLSNKNTPNSEVAINEPTNATVFCLSPGFFGLGRGPSGMFRGVFPSGSVAGLLSELPDNPSCVKFAMLSSCIGSAVENSRGKLAAIRKSADSTRVRG